MADAVVLDRWSASGIRLSAVVEALTTLRDQTTTGRPGHARAAARTAVMTLVAVATSDDRAYGVTEALRNLAGNHPARIITIRPYPDQVSSLNARTTLYAVGSDHGRVTFEEILLEVGGQAARHLDSLIESFTLSDLPLVVWYVGAVPDATDPLISVATSVLIDSRDTPDLTQMRGLLALARRRTVVDLSWKRVHPWREMLASLFDPPLTRPWVDRIDRAVVTGKAGPRRLLGGWLVAQGGLAPARVALHDSRHVSVRVTSPDGAVFSVERVDSQRLVTGEALLPTGGLGPAVRGTAELPEDPLASSLSAALSHMRPDPVWERALSAATALPGD